MEKTIRSLALLALLFVGLGARSQSIIDITYKNSTLSADGLTWTFDVYGVGEASYTAPGNNNWSGMDIRFTLPTGVTINAGTPGSGTGNAVYADAVQIVNYPVPGGGVGISINRTPATESDLPLAPTPPVRLASFTIHFASPITSLQGIVPRMAANVSGSFWAAQSDVYTRRTLAQPSSVLPVTLIGFTAVAIDDCGAQLNWTSANESNNSRYEIGYSADGKAFATVGEKPSENSAKGASYTYVYNGLANGTNFFRLKMVDIDGRFAYSPIATVIGNCNGNGNNIISVYPNPVSNVLHVQGIAAGNQLSLIDLNGRKLTVLTATGNSQTIDMDGYAKGVYILKVEATSGTSNIKVVKE